MVQRDRKSVDIGAARRARLARAARMPLVDRVPLGARVPKELMFQIQEVAIALGRQCGQTRTDEYRVVIAALASSLPDPTDSAAMQRFVDGYARSMDRFATGAASS